jgi:hypothetical protein
MNPEQKFLLDEMHRLFNESDRKWDSRFAESDRKWDVCLGDSEKRLEQHFVEIEDSINKRFAETDDSLTQRFAESDLNWERRITDSELRQSDIIAAVERRQDTRIDTIFKATGLLESWRRESEGEVDDLKLKITKLTKYYDRSVFDNPPATAGIITVAQSPVE